MHFSPLEGSHCKVCGRLHACMGPHLLFDCWWQLIEDLPLFCQLFQVCCRHTRHASHHINGHLAGTAQHSAAQRGTAQLMGGSERLEPLHACHTQLRTSGLEPQLQVSSEKAGSATGTTMYANSWLWSPQLCYPRTSSWRSAAFHTSPTTQPVLYRSLFCTGKDFQRKRLGSF